MELTDRLVYVGYGACAVIAFGALAPWVTSGPVTTSGVDTQYGIYVLAMAGFAAFVLWRWAEFPKWEFLVGLGILAGICLVASGYLALELNTLLDLAPLRIGWGLVMTIAGSACLLGVAGLLYQRERA